MKYVIVIPDGCADETVESLGGKTPLQAANVPWMDRIAEAGVVGRANHVPPGYTPGSDVANLSLIGYDPTVYFTGRAPLEAAAQGIELGPADWAIRCNLVSIQDQIMKDFTAGHISTEEATELLKSMQESLTEDYLEFVPGVSYRNLLLYRGESKPAPFSRDTRSTPPHDLTDDSVANDFPRGPGSDLLNRLMSESLSLFEKHPVNEKRQAEGKLPATNVWLWGLGQAPDLTPFAELHHGIRGRMITAVDLLRGLAALVGWPRIEVPGATGYLDTDYGAKGQYALEAIRQEEVDLVCVHIEAPDEASHEGRVDEKVKALEAIDHHIVGPLYELLKEMGEFRMLVTPDHPTFIRTKTHSPGFVPFTIAGSDVTPDEAKSYDETVAGKSDLSFEPGFRLMDFFTGS
ncbi:Cofactor-independent phosphoglycerate mutase [Planctomycetales bacterium 10988]|nr:Cofactor-independent phosphoglycerate mutase [Planctomycetales bacterium 10988]